MNTIDKIIKSWWVILSLIPYINGFGILHLGFKHNNPNWVLEGITYEIPWIAYILTWGIYGPSSFQGTLMVVLGLMLLLVSIIRSIWLAVKLTDVYDNNEKYTNRQTELHNSPRGNDDNTSSSNTSETSNQKQSKNDNRKSDCCLCMLPIFVIFAIIAII